MTPRNRATQTRLITIERALLNAELRLQAVERHGTGEMDASAAVLAIHGRIRHLVEQAARLHPTSPAGLAAKARIVGRHHDLVTVGRVVLRSLVEDLHVLEPMRRQ